MKKWNVIEQTSTSDGETISLVEHDGDYSIRVGSVELMSTRQNASEIRLAELACAHLSARRSAKVLIGGLGFGFTLKAALSCLASDASVVTAEVLAEVISWNRNPAFPLAGAAMSDPRVTIVQRDVFDLIREASASFDSILLDVDNGPVALTTGGNARLYDERGLRLIHGALKPGGCAAFWSAAPDAGFAKLFARADFEVTTQHCRSRIHAGRSAGRWHTIFIGRR